MKALSETEILQCLKDTPLWQRVGKEIKRKFKLAGFMESIGFVNQVAAYAESVNHHADIFIQYDHVTLTLSTHDADGLTKKDFDFARVADGLQK